MAIALNDLTYCVLTFGCQMNKHDSERVSGMLDALGATQVTELNDADIAVFMTCCVREAAEVRLFGQIASCKNEPLRSGSPLDQRIIAIGGCIGQRDGEELLARFSHVSIVFGTHSMASLPGMLQDRLQNHLRSSDTTDDRSIPFSDLPQKREHAWAAWVPIMTGCDNFCTYCIVPYVRGRERSRPIKDVVDEAERAVRSGVKEITLLGQNVNSYGRDRYGEPRFAEVLRRVDATGIERLRFVTSHPKDLSDEVIDAFASLSSLMPALHLPFQSGSDRILRAMNRSYTRERYLDLIAKLKRACPGIALSTDIIVGFPGETDEDFEATYDLVRQVGFAQAFTFIYSPRSGTPAASMTDEVDRAIVQARFDRLVGLVQDQAYRFNQAAKGETIGVLVEGTSKRDECILAGKSPKNQTVHASIPDGVDIDELIGSIVPVWVDEARTWYLSGTVVDG